MTMFCHIFPSLEFNRTSVSAMIDPAEHVTSATGDAAKTHESRLLAEAWTRSFVVFRGPESPSRSLKCNLRVSGAIKRRILQLLSQVRTRDVYYLS